MNNKKLVLIVAIILLIVIGFSSWYYFKLNKVVATVTIDINPSIEIGLNYKNKVINIKGLNKDGKELIKDNKIREDLKLLIGKLPDYFFEIPASSTGKYHPAYATTEHGLVKHTKVAVRIAYVLLNNPIPSSSGLLIYKPIILCPSPSKPPEKPSEKDKYCNVDLL